jgi:hypothetical protein
MHYVYALFPKCVQVSELLRELNLHLAHKREPKIKPLPLVLQYGEDELRLVAIGKTDNGDLFDEMIAIGVSWSESHD